MRPYKEAVLSNMKCRRLSVTEDGGVGVGPSEQDAELEMEVGDVVVVLRGVVFRCWYREGEEGGEDV
jgi:hypothetical protein